jgi:CheY-like chemotaxis protein
MTPLSARPGGTVSDHGLVALAADGELRAAFAKAALPDVVLLDLNLPGGQPFAGAGCAPITTWRSS